MNTRRMILIDPFERTVTEVEVADGDNGYQEILKTLSGPGLPVAEPFPDDPAGWAGLEREERRVDLIDIIRVGDGVDLIIDDEGRLVERQACFQLGTSPDFVIGGRALIAGHDELGNTIGTDLRLGYAAAPVKWLPYDFDYTPPPPRIMVMGEDGKWEDVG